MNNSLSTDITWRENIENEFCCNDAKIKDNSIKLRKWLQHLENLEWNFQEEYFDYKEDLFLHVGRCHSPGYFGSEEGISEDLSLFGPNELSPTGPRVGCLLSKVSNENVTSQKSSDKIQNSVSSVLFDAPMGACSDSFGKDTNHLNDEHSSVDTKASDALHTNSACIGIERDVENSHLMRCMNKGSKINDGKTPAVGGEKCSTVQNTGKKRGRKKIYKAGQTLEEDLKMKRDRNNEASKKFRQSKKSKLNEVFEKEKELIGINNGLKERYEKMKREKKILMTILPLLKKEL